MKTKVIWAILIFILFTSNINALEEGVKIPLVADRSTGNGEEGVLLSAEVIVTNGTGHVFVDTNPYTQVDLQGSARLAAMVASDVLGVDQRNYDFYYIIDISSPIIGGPSAGGALTVATIAAINKWTLRSDVVMTGMINPDESIGPVGGIPFKLEASANQNYSLFLIPPGQKKVVVKRTISKPKGAFIVYEEKEEEIDVIELGKQYNMTVREVSSIHEVVKAFTGKDLKKPEYKGNVLTSSYLALLEPLASSLKNESKEMYKQIVLSVPEIQEIAQARENINEADKMYDEQKYYAATSLYFNSIYFMRYALWNDGYKKSYNKEEYLEKLVERVDKQIKISESELENFKSYGISDVGAIGAAESRITVARANLEKAKRQSDINTKLASLAFANERARTSQWWLTLATPSSKVVPSDILKDRAGWYLSQAQSINTYAETLLTEAGGHPNLLDNANEDLENAKKEMQLGYYSGAIFDSLQATVKSSTTIGLIGQNDVSLKIQEGDTSAKAAINEARMNGIEPTLGVSAYEFGETRTSPYDKISQYSYAKMISKTLIILNSHAIETNRTAVKPILTPSVIETPYPYGIQTEPEVKNNTKSRKTKVEIPGFTLGIAIVVILIIWQRKKI